MLIFKTLRWKNLLSTGNSFIEIPLNKHQTSLFIGENGAGKSTILDAFVFALFGKAFRKVNKSGLVNSVNNKDCVVEIEFETNNKEYKIIRGIKPNIFEIYCDGKLLNQDAASRDYQEYMEKFILKMNYKSCVQIIILGSASFTPFMQLSAADRRLVIEDILDIQIFSIMNSIVKQRLSTNKEDIDRNRIETSAKNEHAKFIEKTLDQLKKNNNEKKLEHTDIIRDYEQRVDTLEKEIVDIEKERQKILNDASGGDKLQKKLNTFFTLRAKIEANKSKTEEDLSFYHDNDDCPTCLQKIDKKFKTSTVETSKKKISEYEDGIAQLNIKISGIEKEMADIKTNLAREQSLRMEITSKKTTIRMLLQNIETTRKALEELMNYDNMIFENQKAFEKTNSEIADLESQKTRLLSEKLCAETAINLLKDGGIKTKIIKQYVPIINKEINKTLSKMGFFVNFEIDEKFEETIKSRYRDEFSYDNFSEGEKQKINLAILFCWREVARRKNSVNTNLLILDEVFDSSLDTNSVDMLYNIIDGSKHENIFVISHRTDSFGDKFDKTYKFEKRGNFSHVIQ